ncbi:conserved hypothetical protein [Ricinus communis]|uniref:Uncharacterized protein n=1 Tax=Ricinus communis TaxID=3988 RepID=B9TED6_RICCO|nr:conserved hypothetical protein [Ricinus communis]
MQTDFRPPWKHLTPRHTPESDCIDLQTADVSAVFLSDAQSVLPSHAACAVINAHLPRSDDVKRRRHSWLSDGPATSLGLQNRKEAHLGASIRGLRITRAHLIYSSIATLTRLTGWS